MTRPGLGAYRAFERAAVQRMESAALIATDRAAGMALRTLRTTMAGAKLGRLGYALGSGSDLKKGGRLRRFGATGFSASGWVHIRSRSERAAGSVVAYTEGADILPTKGWLWIATDAIPARVGRYRMTPSRWRAAGLDSRIGPLVQIPGRNAGESLLVVKNVTTRITGRANARRLPRNGRVRAGREVRDQIVAFIGIRRTSRQARVNVRAIMTWAQSNLPRLIADAMGDR
ncbi:MAG: hypothetical protein DI547_04995 [Sphingobium sp.]|nr:MAG: hypothetical protein DI547_04995 [Sphingobium sp.]